MSKPDLRAELEADLEAHLRGEEGQAEVLHQQVQKYKQVFIGRAKPGSECWAAR